MNRGIGIGVGVVLAVVLAVGGLWGWQSAETVVRWVGWERRTVGAWSVKAGAVGLLAAAQVVVLWLVADRVYRPGAVSVAARLSGLLILMACAVSAIALGMAGR